MKVMAIDPGGTTGWALYDTLTDQIIGGQIGPTEHHNDLIEKIAALDPDLIVYERFEHRENDFAELISLEYIGVIKLWCVSHMVPKVAQGAHQAKNWATNERLERLGEGWLVRPILENKDQNDARRHLSYLLCASANRNTKLALLVKDGIRRKLLLRLKTS